MPWLDLVVKSHFANSVYDALWVICHWFLEDKQFVKMHFLLVFAYYLQGNHHPLSWYVIFSQRMMVSVPNIMYRKLYFKSLFTFQKSMTQPYYSYCTIIWDFAKDLLSNILGIKITYYPISLEWRSLIIQYPWNEDGFLQSMPVGSIIKHKFLNGRLNRPKFSPFLRDMNLLLSFYPNIVPDLYIFF